MAASPTTSAGLRLRDLRGLGPKSEAALADVGIKTVQQLRARGAIAAFSDLVEARASQPSLNFLYALVGALEDRDWRDVAREDRSWLLSEVEGQRVLNALFAHASNNKTSL